MVVKQNLNMNSIFIGLSVGLTFISMAAGVELYSTLFGIYMAILISVIFELLRLTALYSFAKFDGFHRGLALSLYVIIAFICFSAATLNFNSQIIEKSDKKQLEIAKSQVNDIYTIKNAFSQKIDEQIQLVEKHKIQMAASAAKFPDSKVWASRVFDDEQKIEELKNKRIEFFNSIKDENSSEWISNQKAILGLKDIKDVYESSSSPIGKAANEFYGIDEVKLQKWAGVLLTLGIEIGIILLMILGTNVKKPVEIATTNILKKEKKQKQIIKNDEVVPAFFDIQEEPEKQIKRKKRIKSSLADSIGE